MGRFLRMVIRSSALLLLASTVCYVPSTLCGSALADEAGGPEQAAHRAVPATAMVSTEGALSAPDLFPQEGPAACQELLSRGSVPGWPVRHDPARRITTSLVGWHAGQGTSDRSADSWIGVTNVKLAGAVGDGQTDDTAALQKCLAGGGAILFPPGTYRITAPLEVDLARTGWTSLIGLGTARLVMAGPGPAIRFLGNHQGTADPNRVRPEIWARERMPAVDGLEIVGEHEQACGIEAIQTMQLTITRTLVRETLHAIRLHQRNRNVIISSCHIYNNRGIGLFLDDVDLHQINVVGSHISYNRGGGIVVTRGYLRNLQVAGCDIELNMGPESPPTANILIDSRESQYGHAEIAITGCTIQHALNAPGSANIRFIGNDAKGRLWGALTIAENVLSDVERNVEIYNARGVSIMGNTFWGAGEEDLVLKGCRNVVIGPNSFDQNPNYAQQGPYRGGILLEDCQDCVLTGLQLAEIVARQAALLIRNCQGLNITNCQIVESRPLGVLLENVRASRFSDGMIRVPQIASNQAAETAPLALRAVNCAEVVLSDNLIQGRWDVPAEGVRLQNNTVVAQP